MTPRSHIHKPHKLNIDKRKNRVIMVKMETWGQGGDPMATRGKGAISLRDVQKTLKDNGYELVRTNRHFIYKKNENNDTFILPRKCHDMLIRRMYKEHSITVR